MGNAKTQFIPLDKGISWDGSWMNRAIGTLYDCMNFVPEDFMQHEDASYSWGNGALIAYGVQGTIPNALFSYAAHRPTYMGYMAYNQISAGFHALTIDDDKILRRDGAFLLSGGANFQDVYTRPVHFKGSTFIPIAGWGGANSNGGIKVSLGASAAFLSGAPSNLSLLTEHHGRLYGAQYRMDLLGASTTNRVYFSDAVGVFHTASDFTDIDEGAEIMNVFTLGDSLYAYHTQGITRILGDPVNGFTNDRALKFEGGTPIGGKVSAFQDFFLFSIGDEPYAFDGSNIRPIMKGYRAPIVKAQGMGGGLAAICASHRITTSKFVPGFLYYDILNDRLFKAKKDSQAALSSSALDYDYSFQTMAAAWNSPANYAFGVSFAGPATGQWYAQKLNTQASTYGGGAPIGASGYTYYATTNPLQIAPGSQLREITVLAELDSKATMTVQVAALPQGWNGLEPTWKDCVSQAANLGGTNRYIYAVPELNGEWFMVKISMTFTAGGSKPTRLWGIEVDANLVKREAV